MGTWHATTTRLCSHGFSEPSPSFSTNLGVIEDRALHTGTQLRLGTCMQSTNYSEGVLPYILLGMTVVTGLIDAVSFWPSDTSSRRIGPATSCSLPLPSHARLDSQSLDHRRLWVHSCLALSSRGTLSRRSEAPSCCVARLYSSRLHPQLAFSF